MDNLALRATVLQGTRAYFTARGYLEVEMPIRIDTLRPGAPFMKSWHLRLKSY